MGVTSYSQVGEDLQLHYLLGGGATPRTYIDVGCLWPVRHSNSYFFYERGGHGLCIDANPEVAEEWRRERPRDVFLNVGIGREPGELVYRMFNNPVFNTFSPARADRVRQRGGGRRGRQPAGERTVEVITLDEAIDRTGFAEGRDGVVDFLSVDVEGLEADVLAGFTFERLRPRVVVCEHLEGRALAAVAETELGALLAAAGYDVAAYTGHDLYFVHRP